MRWYNLVHSWEVQKASRGTLRGRTSSNFLSLYETLGTLLLDPDGLDSMWLPHGCHVPYLRSKGWLKPSLVSQVSLEIVASGFPTRSGFSIHLAGHLIYRYPASGLAQKTFNGSRGGHERSIQALLGLFTSRLKWIELPCGL